MVKFVDDLYFLNEVSNVLVPEASLFDVFFDCHLLSVEFAQEDLTIAASSDWLYYLDLVFAYQESKFNSLFLQVFRYFV